MENSATNTTEPQKPAESFDQKYWKKIFISSCLFAFLVDPLYLYVPILKDDIKCLMLDPKLKIVVLLLRILTDLFYIMDIFIRIYRSVELKNRQHRIDFNFVLKSCVPRIAKAIWACDILTDIVALLPLPYVVILSFFSKMSDLRSLTTKMVWMNVFVLFPYVPRVLRIYLSFKELKKRSLTKEIRDTPIWIKCALNFYMYLIASHVAGALWYFFAIQRMMICWHSACRKNDGCDNRIFGCHDHHFFRNITILNDLCPVSVGDNSSDTMFFDFGIFATVVKYGVVGSTSFKKVLNCFGWGLRNLSSFGSNLDPSADGWENVYTNFISITGLLLFLYLIGNLQIYGQLDICKEAPKHRKMIKEEIERNIDELIRRNGIPEKSNQNVKSRIMEELFQEDKVVYWDILDWYHLVSLLSSDFNKEMRSYMPLIKLMEMPAFQTMDDKVLKEICNHLQPKKYHRSDNIIEKGGDPIQMMLMVEGKIRHEGREKSAGEFYGEELLNWPFLPSFPDEVPRVAESPMVITDVVEALVLSASDMRSVATIFRKHFIMQTRIRTQKGIQPFYSRF